MKMRVTQTEAETNKIFGYFLGVSEFINKWVCGDITSIPGKIALSIVIIFASSLLMGAMLK